MYEYFILVQQSLRSAGWSAWRFLVSIIHRDGKFSLGFQAYSFREELSPYYVIGKEKTSWTVILVQQIFKVIKAFHIKDIINAEAERRVRSCMKYVVFLWVVRLSKSNYMVCIFGGRLVVFLNSVHYFSVNIYKSDTYFLCRSSVWAHNNNTPCL